MDKQELRKIGGVTLSDIMGTPKKYGIAPESMTKLFDMIRDILPEETFQIVKKIIDDCSTSYF